MVTGYAPHQGALIRCSAVAVKEINMHGGIAANHGCGTAWRISRLRIWVLSEELKARRDRLAMCVYSIPHSCQVVFAVQHAGMNELVLIPMSVRSRKAAKSEGN
jgi:hypothetical protein